jgi:quercetin dioxygenase-like cupin family protein
MKKSAYLTAGMLLGILITCLAFTVGSRTAVAQDPVKLEPELYKVLLDNEQVRVIDYHLDKGQKEPMHNHATPAVVYWFTDASLLNTLPDGKSKQLSGKAGEAIWRGPATHTTENVGDSEVHALVVECKTCK